MNRERIADIIENYGVGGYSRKVYLGIADRIIAEEGKVLEACKEATKYLQKMKDMSRLFADGVMALDKCKQAIEPQQPKAEEGKVLEACKNLLYWKKLADTTPELLLSGNHAKSDECSEIMRNYMESFKILEQAINAENEQPQQPKLPEKLPICGEITNADMYDKIHEILDYLKAREV